MSRRHFFADGLRQVQQILLDPACGAIRLSGGLLALSPKTIDGSLP
jgi:hypothetical protein